MDDIHLLLVKMLFLLNALLLPEETPTSLWMIMANFILPRGILLLEVEFMLQYTLRVLPVEPLH